MSVPRLLQPLLAHCVLPPVLLTKLLLMGRSPFLRLLFSETMPRMDSNLKLFE